MLHPLYFGKMQRGVRHQNIRKTLLFTFNNAFIPSALILQRSLCFIGKMLEANQTITGSLNAEILSYDCTAGLPALHSLC